MYLLQFPLRVGKKASRLKLNWDDNLQISIKIFLIETKILENSKSYSLAFCDLTKNSTICYNTLVEWQYRSM